jgi:hypothetical protein
MGGNLGLLVFGSDDWKGTVKLSKYQKMKEFLDTGFS